MSFTFVKKQWSKEASYKFKNLIQFFHSHLLYKVVASDITNNTRKRSDTYILQTSIKSYKLAKTEKVRIEKGLGLISLIIFFV